MNTWKKYFAMGMAVIAGMMTTACAGKTGTAAVEQEVAAEIEETAETAAEEAVSTEAITAEVDNQEQDMEVREMYVTVNGTTLTAALEDNSSADALLEKLSAGDITVDMSDYANFEKVGSLGFDLPTNDEQITTKAGDIILYQGSNIVFYYDTNSWNFTKLGEFQDVTQAELKELFGDGNIKAVISAEQ